MISKMSTINQNNEKKSSAENSKQEEETMMEVDVQPEKAETVEAAARGERAEMIEKAEMFERAERAGCKISGSFLPVDESGEDNEEGFDIDKILDYYIREPGSPARAVPPVVTNTSASAGAACAEKAADVAYTAHGAATSCSSGTDVETNLKKIFNNITDESMVSDENKSALMQSAQEQLFIDWCTSRQIMTKKDGDE
ncbi:uncharacterized protein LOC112054198 [Bicyclus anynana]|uniref:Uncharacterized protein LOC112054198 n=1 Tax=Bicyclus anynana TaxID=110368 RepID=A0A6J1NS94_BICAN|nr:uncharacterized protein LOC112054198 [Bicyclus anynana]